MTTTALAQRLTALRSVARDLERRATHAPQDPITALTRRVDSATYRAVLAYPWWTLIRQAINELGQPFSLFSHQREILRKEFRFDVEGRLA